MPVMSLSGSVYIKTILLFSLSENQVVFTNSGDPDDMSHKQNFTWLFTVCKSTRYGVNRQWINIVKINEPVHKMLVLFSCVNTCSERADELARPRTRTVSSGDSLLAYI